MKKYFLGILSGIAICLFLGCSYFIYFFFLRTTHPHPPKLDASFAQIWEVYPVEVPEDGVEKRVCDPQSLFQLAALTDDVLSLSANNENADSYADNCSEYRLNDIYSVINYDGYDGKIFLRKKLKEESVYYPIFSSTKEYPGWSHTILKVLATGEIYLLYGGWNYFGNEKSGTLTYRIDLPIEKQSDQ